jgi:hypothetical protein
VLEGGWVVLLAVAQVRMKNGHCPKKIPQKKPKSKKQKKQKAANPETKLGELAQSLRPSWDIILRGD